MGFVADHVGKDWNEAIDNENVIGRSPIYGSAKSSWKSVESGCYNWNLASGQRWTAVAGFRLQENLSSILWTLGISLQIHIYLCLKVLYMTLCRTNPGVEQIISGTFMENPEP